MMIEDLPSSRFTGRNVFVKVLNAGFLQCFFSARPEHPDLHTYIQSGSVGSLFTWKYDSNPRIRPLPMRTQCVVS
jgi:hypothetical protein